MEIDLTTLGFLSTSTTAFLKKEPGLTQLIPTEHPFFSIKNAIQGKAGFSKENRQILVETLKNQYQRLHLSDFEIVNNHIESLLEADTYTVTTGQQLHLFLGPAFMVYKLISTIKTATHLQTLYPDKKFVPIYWLASEDHDFEEIKNTPLFGQNYEWQTNQTGACGTYHLKDLPPLFEQLRLKLVNDKDALKLISEFEAIYNSSENLSDATIRLTHHLFGQYGLLCLDANNHALKTLFKPVIQQEIAEQRSEKVFNEFSRKMTDNQLSLQLKSRDINLFYLKGPIRSRLEFKEGKYGVIGTTLTFSPEELQNEINAYPEHFSPNAVLRPVYQEIILPNVSYIGGNAEINYWLQLKEVFELYSTSPPSLQLRQSAWIIKPKQTEWLNSKEIGIKDLFAIRTDADKLQVISKSEAINPFSAFLERFNILKDETLAMASREGLRNIKEVSENGKFFEKNLKELVKSEGELLVEKNRKDLLKLEQLMNSGFSTKIIQERTIYALEFLINTKDYLDKCIFNIATNPGHGYFLQL